MNESDERVAKNQRTPSLEPPARTAHCNAYSLFQTNDCANREDQAIDREKKPERWREIKTEAEREEAEREEAERESVKQDRDALMPNQNVDKFDYLYLLGKIRGEARVSDG